MARRVLVVDDDPMTLDLLRTLLDLEEFVVETASDGSAALEAIEAQRPDLVVLDVMMPEVDGFEVCRRIKSAARTARIPVLLLTARDSSEDRELGREAGCDAYLTKPFSPLELIDRLGSLGVEEVA